MISVLAAGATLEVSAPAGFVARPTAHRDGRVSAYEVVTREEDAGCEVSTRTAPETAGLSQVQINALTAAPDYLSSLRTQVGAKFDNPNVKPFTTGAVRGGALMGLVAGSGGEVRTLVVILDTPGIHTTVTCSALPARFEALRPAFEAITRGIRLSAS